MKQIKIIILCLSLLVSPVMAATGSGIVSTLFTADSAAKPRVQNEKLREIRKSVKDFGAVGNGIANDTQAFTAARAATGGNYFVPSGTYVVDASPDVFADGFSAAPSTFLKIAGTTYEISNSFASALRYKTLSPVLTSIVHAKSGNTIMQFQDGAGGTATYFYRGLAFKTDSHWVQVKPATVGGSTDLLWQRSADNADANGNRFNTTFEENNDRLLTNYATTASGLPNFDSAMALYAGTSPALHFPALRPVFQQGWSVQTRAGGALKLSLVPGATAHTLQDETTGNALQKITKSAVTTAGIAFNTLADVPALADGVQRWGGSFSDLTTPLPVTKTLFTATGASYYAMIGTVRVAAVTSGGTRVWRESRFTYDGATVTMTDLVNTLPPQITATIVTSGSNVNFSASYAGGLGGGIALSVSVEWSHAGR